METASIIFTGVIIAISLMWFYNKKGVILDPFMFVGAICFLVQVVGPLFWKINGTRIYRGVPIMDYIIQAELVFTIGYIAFWYAYSKAKPKHKEPVGRLRTTGEGINIDLNISYAYLLYFICFILYTIYLGTKGRSLLTQLTLGQRGTFYNDISTDSSFLFLAISINMLITLACLLLFAGKGRIKYLIYIVTLLLTISSGRRHLMLDVVLAPLIILSVKKKRNPRFGVLVIAAIVAYLLVGWIGAMRSVYRYGRGDLVAYNTASAWAAVMINLEVFMPLCMYIPGMKTLSSFSLGTTYIKAIVQLVPSIIFPFKRQVLLALTRGASDQIIGSRFLNEGIAGTFWSGLYSNGWIIGVIIGMALLGRWVKRIEMKPSFGRLTYVVEYALVTTFMFQFLTRSFGNAIQDWLGLVLPLVVLRRMQK